MHPTRLLKTLITTTLTLAAFVTLNTADVSFAAERLPSDAVVEAEQVVDVPEVSRTFDVTVHSVSGEMLYDFVLEWTDGHAPTAHDVVDWVTSHDPRVLPSGVYCVNIFSNYCVGVPGS